MEPVLIVEVLAPALREVDRVRKLADYRTLSSVQEILVFHGARRVTLQRRTPEGWRVEELIGQASIALGCCEAPIPLEALYAEPARSGP
jgi:Uma2 family endonuclease